MTAGLRVKWIKWGCLPHVCLCQDLEVHWETPTAFSSSFPPFPLVPIAQAPSEKLLQTPIRDSASKATKRLKPLATILTWVSTNYVICLFFPTILHLSFPAQLTNCPSLDHLCSFFHECIHHPSLASCLLVLETTKGPCIVGQPQLGH